MAPNSGEIGGGGVAAVAVTGWKRGKITKNADFWAKALLQRVKLMDLWSKCVDYTFCGWFILAILVLLLVGWYPCLVP